VENASELTVLGIFLHPHDGEESPFLRQILDGYRSLMNNSASATNIDWSLDLREDLFPFETERAFFTYLGSLTTPPCNEVVTWIVMAQSIPATRKQLEELHSLIGFNARPPQHLGSRQVKMCGVGTRFAAAKTVSVASVSSSLLLLETAEAYSHVLAYFGIFLCILGGSFYCVRQRKPSLALSLWSDTLQADASANSSGFSTQSFPAHTTAQRCREEGWHTTYFSFFSTE